MEWQLLAKIDQRARIILVNWKAHAMELEVTLGFGGRAKHASHGGKITLSAYRNEDWERFRGDPAVNKSSLVRWRVTLKPGESFEPTVEYEYYTRR